MNNKKGLGMSKYKSKIKWAWVEEKKHKFDSLAEYNRYNYLANLVKRGIISELILQPEFLLQEKFKRNGKTIRAIKYIADFKYYDVKMNTVIVEDVKGMKTDVYKLKAKLFLHMFGNLYRFFEVKVIRNGFDIKEL